MDHSAEPFSIAYVKFNRRQGTGGDIARYDRCITTGTRAKGTRSEKPARPVIMVSPEQREKLAKNPGHFRNATRNLQVLPSFVIRKLHIWLIIEFNGMKVVL